MLSLGKRRSGSASADLVARSGNLKHDLVEFGYAPEFQSERLRAVTDVEEFYWAAMDEAEAINVTDRFLLQHRLKDGRTVVERFVEAHPELPEAEREMLLGWRNVVEGIFEVERRDGPALVAVNLFDDLTYRIRSNKGPRILKNFPPGSFLHTRVVPVGEEWVLSGASASIPAEDRDEVYATALEILARAPSYSLMNPVARERAWGRQREDRARFIAFFGTDTIVLRRDEFCSRMDAFMRYRMREAAAAAGVAVPDDLPEELHTVFPEDAEAVETFGVIYDEVEGMHILPDYALLAEAFEKPDLAGSGPHRDILLDYLMSPDMHPLPLRRLADADPKRASAAFRAALGRPSFSWKRSGEVLLRKYKPEIVCADPLPGITIIGERLLAFERAQNSMGDQDGGRE